MKKQNKADKIRKYMAKYPEAKPSTVALDTGVSVNYVYYILSQNKKGVVPKKVQQKAAVARLRIKKARLQKKIEKLETTPHIPLSEQPKHTVTGVSGQTYEMHNFLPERELPNFLPQQKLSFFQKVGGFFKSLF